MGVSIVIPCYNLGNYVSQAIESAIAQTTKPEEIIIIDDASTDNYQEIVLRYENNPIVKIIFNDHNLGLIDTFNIGVKSVNSDFFTVLSADDWLENDFIEKHLAVEKQKPNCAIYYCDFIVFGSRAAEFAERNELELLNGECILTFPEPTQNAIDNIRNKNMLHGTSMCSKDWFIKVGGYRKSDLPEDLDFGIRVLENGGKIVHVPHALLHYRQHSISQTHSQKLISEVLIDKQKEIDLLRERINWLDPLVDAKNKEIIRLESINEAANNFFPTALFGSLEHYLFCMKNNNWKYKINAKSRKFGSILRWFK